MKRIPAAALQTAIRELLARDPSTITTRDPRWRRRYAEDPCAWARDIAGVRLIPQQEEALAAVLRHRRVGWQSANDVGKTFLLGLILNWVMDARGAIEGPHGEERGAIVILPGVDLASVRQTVWREAQRIATAAERRGHAMPGRRFVGKANNLLWAVTPDWFVEATSPPRDPNRRQAHAASGRHAEELWVLGDEGAGLNEPLWNAMQGVASSAGNRIVLAWNPTERRGVTYGLSRRRGWIVLELSGLDHPNVVERRPVIPRAIAHQVVDEEIADPAECTDLGPYPEVRPVPEHDDFVYALPPEGATDPDPRDDGFRGHRQGQLRVYRPRRQFGPRRLGRYPKDDSAGLIDAAAWDRAVQRWLAADDPLLPPARIGIDAAGEGRDKTCVAPSWGEMDAAALLADWVEAAVAHDHHHHDVLRQGSRIRVGEIEVLSATHGPAIAQAVLDRWPRSYYAVEYAGAGQSVWDQLTKVEGCPRVTRIYTSGAPPDGSLLPEEILCGNYRAWMAAAAAQLINRDLVDVPDDPELREEMLTLEFEPAARKKVIEGQTVDVVYLLDRRKLKHRLGRSPDRAFALMLCLCPPEPEDDDAPFMY